MKTSSPLRYPGGKSSMAGLLGDIRKLNGLGDRAIAEPYAGGAGASLNLLFLEETHKIFINDADDAIYDFWWTLVNRPQPFFNLLSIVEVIWRRVLYSSTWNKRVVFTLDVFDIFPRSLRNKSTIIMFSARFLGSLLRNFCSFISSCVLIPRGIVPFIGRTQMCSFVCLKNNSGE